MRRAVQTVKLVAGAASAALILAASPPGHGTPFDADYFAAPLKTELILAGNFAEMRSNHFHAGLDLKTEGREGLAVVSAADGWVSRIKVSPYGYGTALYVNHPNGYTTVYGHLQQLDEPMASYVRDLQYKRKRFDLNVYPKEGQFRVSKGQQIALSGNTGGSFAPHLHFEIRESASQTPVNPLLFDFDITDSLPPRIFRVKLYPDGASSYVRVEGSPDASNSVATHENPAVLRVVSGRGEPEYQLAEGTSLTGFGRLGFGIETNDYHDGSNNRLGAFRVRLEVNTSPVFVSKMERVRFDETRYINAHVDYGEYQKNRRWIQRSYKLPGNHLSLYEIVDGGMINLSADSTYRVRYTVEDAAGNLSSLAFVVRGEEKSWWAESGKTAAETIIPRTESFTFARNQLRVQFDANTFYEDQPFEYELRPQIPEALSPVHRIHEDVVPLHRSMTISIRAGDLPERIRDKALLGTLTDKGEVASAGGAYKNGFVVGRPRSFGTYFVIADTTAPEVELRGASSDVIRFKVSDDLSGIGSYNAFVNDEWVLLEYDPKKSEMLYRPTSGGAQSQRTLSIVVDDNKGNRTSSSFDLTF